MQETGKRISRPKGKAKQRPASRCKSRDLARPFRPREAGGARRRDGVLGMELLVPRLSRAEIMQPLRKALRHLFEKAKVNPDAYKMIEIMCVNELAEANLKTREYDVLEVIRARNDSKQLEVKAAHLEQQNQVAEARAANLRLQVKSAQDKLDETVQQAREARQGSRPFDYERALNQISAVIGLRGPEEFVHDQKAAQAN